MININYTRQETVLFSKSVLKHTTSIKYTNSLVHPAPHGLQVANTAFEVSVSNSKNLLISAVCYIYPGCTDHDATNKGEQYFTELNVLEIVKNCLYNTIRRLQSHPPSLSHTHICMYVCVHIT